MHKISIISRGRALGYTLSIPAEDKVLNSRNEMFDELAMFLGGRVAEEIFCDDITTGASNDLERATKMARAMVTQYGMTDLGTQIFGQPNHEVFLGRDYGNTQDYSEETARRIDEQVALIMKQAHDRAYEILSSHADQMHTMAGVLLERETVDGDACQALLDDRWEEYLAHEQSDEGRAERERAATTLAQKPAEEGVIQGQDPCTAQAVDADRQVTGIPFAPVAPVAHPVDKVAAHHADQIEDQKDDFADQAADRSEGKFEDGAALEGGFVVPGFQQDLVIPEIKAQEESCQEEDGIQEESKED